MKRFLKFLLGVVLFLGGLYFGFVAVMGAVIMRDPLSTPLLIPAGVLIAVAVAVLKWAREPE